MQHYIIPWIFAANIDEALGQIDCVCVLGMISV